MEIKTKVKHPLYKKQIIRTTRLKAQNEIEAKIGQKVKIITTKPIAKTEAVFLIIKLIGRRYYIEVIQWVYGEERTKTKKNHR